MLENFYDSTITVSWEMKIENVLSYAYVGY